MGGWGYGGVSEYPNAFGEAKSRGESDTSGRSDGRHSPPRGDGSGISVFTGVSGDLANSSSHSQMLQITVDTHRIAVL